MRRGIFVIGILFIVGAAFYMSKAVLHHGPMLNIGVLSLNEARLEKVAGLKDELQKLNYEEGKDISYEVLTAHNDLAKLDRLAEELAAKKFNVLVAAGAGETRSLAKATEKLKDPPPIIFMGTLSPIALGLVESEAYPTTNVTGLNNYHFELAAKRLELLKRLIPHIQHVAVLGENRTTFFKASQPSLTHAAQGLNITYKMYDFQKKDDIHKLIDEIGKTSDAILIMPGSLLETNTEAIASYAKPKGLPVFGVYPGDIHKGCIASYGTSYYSQGAQSAQMVHKALMGYSPKNIPVETPEKIAFSVNLQIAEELGICLNESCVCFADEVAGQGGTR